MKKILAIIFLLVALIAPLNTEAHHRATHKPTPTPTPTPTSTPSLPTATPDIPPPTGTTCSPGYVFLESQGWWKDNVRPSDEVGEHVHVGTCWKWGGTVSGSFTTNVRILLHNNPATLVRLRPHIVYTNNNQSLQNVVEINETAPGGNGEWWIPVTFDTSVIPVDGWQEFRFMVMLRNTDGKEQYASTGWMLYLQNGKPVDHYKPDAQAPAFTEGRGWYTTAEYANARWASPARTTPVSGTWTFNVSLTNGAGGTPVTFHAVYVDPDFHHGSSGTVIKQGSGPYVGSISINTSAFTNGQHRLVLRADSQISTGRNSGLLVIPFTVQN